MVMRNANDGSNARRWWDDLPPRIRTRVSDPAPQAETEGEPAEPGPLVTTGELARDLSQLTLLFFAIAIANMLFLLVALAFIGT